MSDVEKNIGTHKPEFDGEWVRLGDVCAKGKSNLRQKDLKNDGPYPVYGASGIVGFSSDYQNAEAYVAVVKDGAGVGRVMACEPRSSVLGTMQALLPGKGTERDYLLHLVRSMDLGKGFTGSTIPHIYFKDYGKTLVRALSREQQVEVANRLSGIDRLISQGKQQLSFLDDLVKSRFVEMFGDPKSNPHGWDIGTIETIAANLDAKRVPITQSDREEGPYPYYGATGAVDSVSGYIFDERLLLVSEDGANLLARTYPIAFSIFGKTWVNNHAHVLKVQNEETQVFLEKLINMMDISEFITGSTQPKLTQKQLNQIPVMLPPMSLQRQFAEFVARVDKLGFDCCREIVCCDALFSSISASLLCT